MILEIDEENYGFQFLHSLKQAFAENINLIHNAVVTL